MLATQCMVQQQARARCGSATRARLGFGVTAKDLILGDDRPDRRRRRGRPRRRVHRPGDRGALDGGPHDRLQHDDRGRRPRRHDRARRDDLRLVRARRAPPARRSGAELAAAIERWRELRSDDGASFDREVVVDASAISPQVTWGTNPGMVVGVTGRVPSPDEFDDAGRPRRGRARARTTWRSSPARRSRRSALDRVFIGSCTNSRIGDLRAAAAVVARPARRRRASARWSCPAPRRSSAQAEAEGLDEVFRDAGFDWRSAGCSMCLGMNPDILAPGERCASTSNRNFEGRQGRGGRTHLVSPGDGRRGGDRGPLRRHPDLELSHGADQRSISGRRSATSTAPTSTPTRSSPSSSSSGSSAPASASSCSSTGRRSPAGSCRATRSSSPARNFGCGSSREHAPWALEDYGFRAIVAPSFARHLLLQLHARSGCCRSCSTRRTCGRSPRAGARRGRPARRRRCASTAGARSPFEIDPEIRHRLLGGLDDIALTLQQVRAIDAYERERERPAAACTTAL